MLIWLLRHWWLFVIVISFYFLFGATEAFLDAWFEFKQAPREPMAWCFKHGYFRKEHTLDLFPELGGTAENSHVCPTCYYDAVFKTPNQRLN